MTSYEIEIKRCPNCSREFIWLSLASCNTFGAKLYTDGCTIGPMYDEGSALLTCPECKNYFWIEEVPTMQLMSENEFSKSPKRSSLPWAGRMEMTRYADALCRSFWKNEPQEKYIRVRYWWLFNDAFRVDVVQNFEFPAEQRENLLMLITLLDRETLDDTSVDVERVRNDPSIPPELKKLSLKLFGMRDSYRHPELIMKAEIYRELGRFEECVDLIENFFDAEYSPVLKTIRRLAENKISQVSVVE